MQKFQMGDNLWGTRAKQYGGPAGERIDLEVLAAWGHRIYRLEDPEPPERLREDTG